MVPNDVISNVLIGFALLVSIRPGTALCQHGRRIEHDLVPSPKLLEESTRKAPIALLATDLRDGAFPVDGGQQPPRCMNRLLIVSSVLPRVSADPDGGRHAERGHPVEHVAANLCLGLLIGQSPDVKPPADNGLVAIHYGCGQAPAIVA